SPPRRPCLAGPPLLGGPKKFRAWLPPASGGGGESQRQPAGSGYLRLLPYPGAQSLGWEAAAANSDPPARSTPPQGSTPGEATRSSNGSSRAPPERDQPMTQRALAVLVVASAALIVYFVIRTVRLRKRNKKTRRYGVLDTNIENMELTPLEQDDDDDDTTLFDANHPRRLVFRSSVYSYRSGGMMMVKQLHYMFKSTARIVRTNFQMK
uniref:Transmembrane protein 157 n=1 Tax=Terrapene triunguis TaxID=2587831 RepID=A0A674JN69_9SAUR